MLVCTVLAKHNCIGLVRWFTEENINISTICYSFYIYVWFLEIKKLDVGHGPYVNITKAVINSKLIVSFFSLHH